MDPVTRHAVQETLALLNQSIAHQRPVSLPNLLRYFRRRAGEASLLAEPLARISNLYRARQPFTR